MDAPVSGSGTKRAQTHAHRFTAMPVPRFNLEPPPAHTSFQVLFCACGHAEIFPRGNYALLSEEARGRFERHLLVEFGLTLDPSA